jgi:RNase P subunit RPR2
MRGILMSCDRCGSRLGPAEKSKILLDVTGPPRWKRVCSGCGAIHISPYKNKLFWFTGRKHDK